MSFQIVFMAKVPLGPPYKSFISCLQISQFKTFLLSSLPSALNATHTICKIGDKNEKMLNTKVQLKKKKTLKARTRHVSDDKEKNEILVHFWRHLNKPFFFFFLFQQGFIEPATFFKRQTDNSI